MKKYVIEVSSCTFNKCVSSHSFVIRDSEIMHIQCIDSILTAIDDVSLLDLCVGDSILLTCNLGKHNENKTYIQVDGGGIKTHGGELCRFCS